MSILDIRVLGDPVLREDTTPVGKITDELRELVKNMFETMDLAKGIGLAAPQVGRTERVAVIGVDDQRFAIINPEVVESDTRRAKAEEGREYVRQRAREMKDQASQWADRGRDAVSSQKEQFRAAYEAGRQAYHEATSETGTTTK